LEAVQKTEDAKFYYDKKDVTQSTQKTVKVWIKQVYMKRGKMDTVTLIGTIHEKLSYLIFTNGLLFQNGYVLDLKIPRSMGIGFYKLDV